MIRLAGFIVAIIGTGLISVLITVWAILKSIERGK